MNILAIDTSSDCCSAALLFGEKVVSKCVSEEKQHTRVILSLIDELLSEASVTMKELNCIAVTSGPGSFTGLRIGISVAQGLAYATDVPVAPISTLAVLAQGVIVSTKKEEAVFCALDARMNEIYYGLYAFDNGLVFPLMSDQIAVSSEIILPNISKKYIGVGSGFLKYREDLLKKLGQENVVMVNADQKIHAKDIIPLARQAYLANKIVTAEKLQPVYLREKVVS